MSAIREVLGCGFVMLILSAVIFPMIAGSPSGGASERTCYVQRDHLAKSWDKIVPKDGKTGLDKKFVDNGYYGRSCSEFDIDLVTSPHFYKMNGCVYKRENMTFFQGIMAKTSLLDKHYGSTSSMRYFKLMCELRIQTDPSVPKGLHEPKCYPTYQLIEVTLEAPGCDWKKDKIWWPAHARA
ncbi:uncharacterized protein LOC142350689 isoform X1 [Convolutriloba macropyga]|uniref:uncharacterized protein LOC142350689 isoform X1 n=2 Tax=Convolutriloba macropyga TaxID=536237 RepID=UPI003F51D291